MTRDDAQEVLDNLGLCRSGPYLAYTDRGWGWFLPNWLQWTVTGVWNRVACGLYGHECLGSQQWEGEEIVDWACFHCGRAVEHD